MRKIVLLNAWLASTTLASLSFAAAADPNTQPTPEWIWTAPETRDNQVAFFRKTFEARPGVDPV